MLEKRLSCEKFLCKELTLGAQEIVTWSRLLREYFIGLLGLSKGY